MNNDVVEIYLEVELEANIDHVFNTLLSNEAYSYWAAAFGGENYYEGILGLGEKIEFKVKDSEGNIFTNYSIISEFTENEAIKFDYYVGDYQSELNGHYERYVFTKVDDNTTNVKVIYNDHEADEVETIKLLKEAFRLMKEWYRLGR